jgi:hypothetical protein
MRATAILLITLSLHYLAVLPQDKYLYYVAAASWSTVYCVIVLKFIRIRESIALAYIELSAIIYMLLTVAEIGLAHNSIWLREHYTDIMQIMFLAEIIVIIAGGVSYGSACISGLWLNFCNFLSSLYRYIRDHRHTLCITTQQAI